MYSVFYEDLRGCAYRDSFTVALHPSNRIDGVSSLELCPEDTISLNWSAPADGVEDYTWSTPDGRLIDNLDDQYPRVSGSGLYLVDYVDLNGCTYRDSVLVSSYSLPNYNLRITPPEYYLGDEISLDFIPDPERVEWQMAEVACSDCYPLDLTLQDSLIEIKALITDDNGCMQVFTSLIEVDGRPAEDLNYPNVISPNGDGRNDVLCIEGPEDMLNNLAELYIMDRNGTVLYQEEEYRNCSWSGQDSRGEDLPDGVYFYRLEFNGYAPIRSSLHVLRKK